MKTNHVSVQKCILRKCDVFNSLDVGKQLKQEYLDGGYEIEDLPMCFFKITLDEGYVFVYWEDGAFWQEIYKRVE